MISEVSEEQKMFFKNIAETLVNIHQIIAEYVEIASKAMNFLGSAEEFDNFFLLEEADKKKLGLSIIKRIPMTNSIVLKGILIKDDELLEHTIWLSGDAKRLVAIGVKKTTSASRNFNLYVTYKDGEPPRIRISSGSNESSEVVVIENHF